jgi:hypothetical protein
MKIYHLATLGTIQLDHAAKAYKAWTYFCRVRRFHEGCQIFLDTIYQNEGKYAKLQQHYQMAITYIPNDEKILQMTIKYTSIFHSKALQNLPKLGFLVWKQTIWQPWISWGTVACLHSASKIGTLSERRTHHRNLSTRTRMFELLLQTFWSNKNPCKNSADLHLRQGN